MSIHHGVAKNARLGLVMFFIYLIFYGGFVYLSAFNAEVMAAHAFAGVNVAVVYGFGLIALALVMALIYLKLAHPVGDTPHEETKS
jgi:uncharacterized membrane protein (DUF485 family)